ncbi:isopentenyl phosphate kinase [Methanorbis rubei]|uniref:Isopentenyl phosphate kinase n=1 Tax=Methanorbis rubei TaxID=3028300 RepID=A0AAE4ME71_9EURY|nr:Acetylglutamate kinase [Methanocorpusculaceae archaeon Cs1]
MSEITVLKLGGSVVTKKSETGVIDTVRIRELAAQIAPVAKSVPLVIVHGAGSCGHPEAKAYHIQDGVTNENAEGIAVTHFAVRRLNEEFVAVLREEGVDAVCMHPFCSSLAQNGRLLYSGEEQIKAMLRLGVVPVLHGDVVMDTIRGAVIVSGDQIVPAMAKALGATRVGVATDVPGVLSEGSVVPVITRENVGSIDLGDSSNTDVTGGMRGKVEELLLLADAGISSHLFHISRVMDFLEDHEHGGTTVR